MIAPQTLSPEVVDAIATRVVELLEERGAGASLVDAATLARRFNLSRAWVYEHADALGAIRLGPSGDGKRPRLRFDPEEVARTLAAPRSEEMPRRTTPRPRSSHRTSRPALLPVKGAP